MKQKNQRLLFQAALLGLMAPTVSATEIKPNVQFSWSDEWSWGGVQLTAPRVASFAPGKNGAPASATLVCGNMGRPAKLHSSGATVWEASGATQSLTKTAVGAPDLTGDSPGALLSVPVWVSDRGRSFPLSRTLAVWQGLAPGEMLMAWRGFWRGQLPINKTPRTAIVADGDGNGFFFDSGADQLWIDLNGDEKLDIVTEQFPVRPLLRVEGQLYSFFIAPSGAARWTPLIGGEARARFHFKPHSGVVRDIAATLASQSGELAGAQGAKQEMQLPVGNYQWLSLEMKLTANGRDWTYSFAQPYGGAQNSFPVSVRKGGVASLVPVRQLRLDLQSPTKVKAGSAITVRPTAKTENGLELNNASDGSANARREDYAKIQLLDAKGKVLANAGSGFA
jgi:hypothetical protein